MGLANLPKQPKNINTRTKILILFKKIRCICIAFSVLFALFILLSINCFKNEQDYQEIKFPIKVITVNELENIVGINFTNDKNGEINFDIQISNDKNVEITNFQSAYATNTQINILYDIKTGLDDKECYLLKWDSIEQDQFTNNYEIIQSIEYLKKNWNIDEYMIKYVNIQYGSCEYEVKNEIMATDYYLYVFIIGTNEETSKIFISGFYPYPIELQK